MRNDNDQNIFPLKSFRTCPSPTQAAEKKKTNKVIERILHLRLLLVLLLAFWMASHWHREWFAAF
jgi:hypothetical protein